MTSSTRPRSTAASRTPSVAIIACRPKLARTRAAIDSGGSGPDWLFRDPPTSRLSCRQRINPNLQPAHSQASLLGSTQTGPDPAIGIAASQVRGLLGVAPLGSLIGGRASFTSGLHVAAAPADTEF